MPGGPHGLDGVLQEIEVGVGDVAGFTLHNALGGVILRAQVQAL